MQKIALKIVIIFAGIIGSIVSYMGIRECFPAYARWNESQQRRDVLQENVERSRQEHAKKNRDIERFKGSRYFVERLARENQRVTENEVIFVLE
jgi:hypothetical protein